MIVIYSYLDAHLRIIRETDPVHNASVFIIWYGSHSNDVCHGCCVFITTKTNYIFLFTQKAGPKDVAVVDISWAIGKFLYNFSFSFYLLTMFYRHPLTPQYWYPGREKGRHLGASFLLFVSFTNDVL